MKNNHMGEGLRASLSDNLIHARLWFANFDEIFIPVRNESGFFRKKLVELAVTYEINSGNWCLVSEPAGVGIEISNYLRSNYNLNRQIYELETLLSVNWSGQEPNYDLCLPDVNLCQVGSYNVVITQSLLEHVIDPVQLLKNLSNIVKPGGIIIIFTHNVLMSLHQYPIDTLRFHTDYFLNLGRYINMNYEYCENYGNGIYSVYRKPLSSLH
jgi:SAM-dependent methyltransferase